MSTAQTVTKTTPRRLSALALIAALALAPLVASGEQAEASTGCSAGSVTANPGSWTDADNATDPRPIANKDELVYLSLSSTNNWDKNYILTADVIDLQGCQWTPIGNDSTKFTGDFDGGNNEIRNLFVNQLDASRAGMFGFADGAKLKNLRLVDVDVRGSTEVGGLVGELDGNEAGVIDNVSVSGTVTATGSSAGGIAGEFDGSEIMRNSFSSVNVNGVDKVGGLVGFIWSDGLIENSQSAGVITGRDEVGGIIGHSRGSSEIVETSATGASVSGRRHVGGLIGKLDGSEGKIEKSFATANVVATGSYSGGLVGRYEGQIVSQSYATGNVTSSEDDVGGLAGRADRGTFVYSFATGAVTGLRSVGGLLGTASSVVQIVDSYARGSVESTRPTPDSNSGNGGLVGRSEGGPVTNSFATGRVSFDGATDIGGLIGNNTNADAQDNASGSFWDTQTTLLSTSAGGAGAVGKTTAEMRSLETFASASWAIVAEFQEFAPTSKVWGICSGEDYPYLLWQFDADPCAQPVSAGAGAETSKPSGPDASAAPGIHLDVQASVGSPVAGAPVVIGGQGLQPGSAYSLVVRSNPITVTSGVASGTGSFSQRVTLPAGIAPGNHTITLRATGSDGSALVLTQSFTVAANGTFSALGAVTGSTTGGLAVTGVNGPLGLGMMSLAALLVFVGAGLILARRRAEVVSS